MLWASWNTETSFEKKWWMAWSATFQVTSNSVIYVSMESITGTNFHNTQAANLKNALNLVHSNVCGKLSTKSLCGLTFISNKTRHVWVYMQKHKNEVYERFFLQWKAHVKKLSCYKLTTLCMSAHFESLKEYDTVLKILEQNSVAERTFVEILHSMLIDAKLSH